MEFILKITLANNAMHTCEDVGDALIKIGSEMIRFGGQDELTPDTSCGKIRDINRQTVGSYQVVPKCYYMSKRSRLRVLTYVIL